MSSRYLLDQLLPRYDVAERHQRVIVAPPERVWQAIGAVTLRELVGGVVGQPWKPAGGESARVGDGVEFAAFRRPGFVKAAMTFRVTARPGGTLVETETRVVATDPASRRRFTRYWRLIRPGSGAIRRSWLRAADRRATQGQIDD